MNIRFYIKIIVGLLIFKFAFAEVIDVDDQEMIKLSNDNIPIVDVRRSSEWDQTGVIPNSILLTFFDEVGNYNFCLLYTSPSPRDRYISRMPSSA